MDYVREIYKEIIEDSSYMDEAVNVIELKIKEHTSRIQKSAEKKDFETYRDMLYQFAAIVEEEAFVVGFNYAKRLLMK